MKIRKWSMIKKRTNNKMTRGRRSREKGDRRRSRGRRMGEGI